MKRKTSQSILEKAQHLLELHGGSCSVNKNSSLAIAFLTMEKAGKVDILHGSMGGFIDVKATPESKFTDAKSQP